MHVRHARFAPVVAFAIGLIAGSFGHRAEAEEVALPEPRIDPRAIEVIDAMVDHFTDARTLQADIASTYLMTMPGMRSEVTSTYEFALDRPGRLAMRLTEGMMGGTLVVDGEHMYNHQPLFEQYTQDEAPEDVETLLAFAGGAEQLAATMTMGMNSLMFVAPVVSREAYEQMRGAIVEAEHLGEAEVDGRAHHHLRVVVGPDRMLLEAADVLPDEFGDASLSIELWVTAGDTPTLTRMKPDFSSFFERAFAEAGEQMPAHMRQMEMDFLISFTNWRIEEPVDDTAFAFDPPEGAELAESMFDFDDLPTRAGNAGPHPLIGEPAPQFGLALLGEGEMNLAAHQERGEIVILDFWATWCGPCVQAMPELIEVRDEYAGRGVVFYAVNQRERPQRVQRFIAQREWDLLVPMDRDGAVSDQYEVRGIPQTVVIDAEGVVQSVHVGASPQLKDALRSEIDTLLAGGSLVD